MNRRRFLRNSAGIIVPLSFGIITHAKAQNNFQLQQQIASAGVAASGATCPADGSAQIATTGAAASGAINNAAATFYIGQVWNDGGTPRTICKVGFQLGVSAGDISSKHFVAYMFTSDGSNITNVGTPLTTSNLSGVVGNNSWNGTFVRFPFLSAVTTTASAWYVFAITTVEASDNTNKAAYYAVADQITGHNDGFNSAGSCQLACGGTGDLGIEIYYQ